MISIPALDLEVPVYADRVPLALERGSSWVSGTAAPGNAGNIVIAGHRDSFFRPLEDIPLGTEITLRTSNGMQQFQVTAITIVDP